MRFNPLAFIKGKICIFFLVIGLGSAMSCRAALPIIQQWKTSKGVPVFFVQRNEIPMVDIEVLFAAGSSHDEEHEGLSALANSLLNESTQQHTADQISTILDDLGAQYNATVNQDMAIVYLRSMSDENSLRPALNIFSEIMSAPNFPEEVVARVKNQTIDAIKYENQSPSTLAFKAFYRSIFGKHPYAHPILGTEDTVKSITREHIQRFYQKYYVTQNAIVVLVGDLSRNRAEEIAENLTHSLSRGEPAQQLALTKNQKGKNYEYYYYPSTQDTIIMGQVGITPNDPNIFPLSVANQILGGLPLSSILFDTIRNREGLVYGISSRFVPLEYKGPFFITLQTRGNESAKALNLTQHVTSNYLSQGPTQQQLILAKRNLIGGFPLKIASNNSILNILAAIAFYRLPKDYLNTYIHNIEAVHLNDAKKAFQKTIDNSQMKTVVVGATNPLAQHDNSE